MFESLVIYSQLTALEKAILLLPLGLVIGSLSSMLLHRIPRGLSLMGPRSVCPQCGHTLGPAELVPVVSFLWQRGRCRWCGAEIPWRYPLLELGSGALTFAAGLTGGWTAGLVALLFWLAVVCCAAERRRSSSHCPGAATHLMKGLAPIRTRRGAGFR